MLSSAYFFLLVETDLNNLLVEETIEVIATWSTFQTHACKNTLPACFSARLCLTSLVSSYMSGGISHLSFQGRMTSSKVCLQAQAPQGALAGRLHRGPGKANAASASSHAAWDGIDQDPDRPKRKRGSSEMLQQDSQAPSRTYYPMDRSHQRYRDGEDRAWLLSLWAKHSRMNGSIQSSGWWAPLSNYVTALNNKWQMPNPWTRCPSHLSSVYRRIWFSATQCHSSLRILQLLFLGQEAVSTTRRKVSTKLGSLLCDWPTSVYVNRSQT